VEKTSGSIERIWEQEGPLKMKPSIRLILPHVVLIVLILSALAITSRTTDVNAQAIAGVSMDLPDRIGEWVGESVAIGKDEQEALGADTEFTRKIYRRYDGQEIFLSIVLSGRDRSSIHPPESCLLGQGWTLGDGQIVKVPIWQPTPYDLKVMRLDATRPFQNAQGRTISVRQWYYYWFIGQSRLTPRHMERILWTASDRIFSNIHHRWAYVAVAVRVVPNSETQTQGMVDDFIRQAIPIFQKVKTQQ
jgi:EpsI family protein